MGAQRLRTRRVLGLILGLVLALAIGTGLPPALIAWKKLLPTDVQLTLTSEASDARLADLSAAAADQECGLACHSHTGTAALEQELHTSPGAKFMQTQLDATTRIELPGHTTAEVHELLELSRDSTFPSPEALPVTTWRASDLPEVAEQATEPRTGVQYFFPFTTERRSYQYFDVVTWRPNPIDYVEKTKVSGLDSYAFAQELIAEPISDGPLRGWLEPLTQGPAQRFYSPEELAQRGLRPEQDITLMPYYTVSREVWVQPQTGTILDEHTTRHIFLAASADEARAAQNSPQRTVAYLDSQFSDATRTQQADHARPQVHQLRFLQVLAWVCRLVAVILTVLLVWEVLRYRSALRRRVLSESTQP
ncbi:porin PorA family protein [Corynebacterium tapiri]|uniref:DUF3068 domain-containing protein n=1 Tax=Corynebacterium tapiri TaxID=1448266 RepID=A0A5C4U192_9CORY|nr:porin PorA family protein [Corynebacterium tapiri]TNL94618.1 DUF3068 domain-containing protein [Corynebacterium tapiri]